MTEEQKEIRKLAKERIYKCKESCYGKKTNADNVLEGDFGKWSDWERVLINFANKILKLYGSKSPETQSQQGLQDNTNTKTYNHKQ